jgi:hypothetical protein
VEIPPHLLAVRLLRVFGKVSVGRGDQALPMLYAILRNRERAVVIDDAEAMKVSLPISPSFVFNRRELFDQVAHSALLLPLVSPVSHGGVAVGLGVGLTYGDRIVAVGSTGRGVRVAVTTAVSTMTCGGKYHGGWAIEEGLDTGRVGEDGHARTPNTTTGASRISAV